MLAGMDWIQVHLAVNHLPVIGVPLFVAVFIAGWWMRSRDVLRVALWGLLILSAGAIGVKYTGDFAAEQGAEHFAPAKNLVAHHEQAGDQATTAIFVLGLATALALWRARNAKPFPRWALLLVLVLGLAASGLYLRSAQTGGKIGHPELRQDHEH